MKKRLLIVGGSYADVPMIVAAKELGFVVYTSGNRPQELGHAYGDGYHAADYSDRDQVLDVARHLGVDALCPSCNDFSAISSAYVARELGLAGHDSLETALTLHHKDRYRAFARAHGIRSPVALSFDDPQEAIAQAASLAFPVMVKPVDLTGGKGVSKVDELDDVGSAVKKAFSISRQKGIVVEEFVAGTRHAISTFIRGGEVVFALTDNEVYFLNPFLVSGAYAPGSVSRPVERELCRDIEKIAALLSLTDGIVHVQFILDEQGPVIIEICRRPPGDLYVKLVQHVTGVDYPKWIVMSFAGLPPPISVEQSTKASILRHCIMAERPGKVEGLHIDPCVRANIVDQMLWVEGAQINDPLSDKVGIMFLKFDSPEELAVRSEQMHELIYPVLS